MTLEEADALLAEYEAKRAREAELNKPGGRIRKVWLIPTPTALCYRPRVVDRLWQPRIGLKTRGVALTNPIYIPAGKRLTKPTIRNYRKLFGDLSLRPKPGPVVHWADVSGLETEEDRRKARNALRRRRQGR